MAQKQYFVSHQPKRIPALEPVPTGETVVIEGKIYQLLKLVRAAKYV